MLADALAQLPTEWRAGHHVGDDPDDVVHRVLIRADAGGASQWLAEECFERNVEFSFGFHIDLRVRDGVMCVPAGCWHHAVDSNGQLVTAPKWSNSPTASSSPAGRKGPG